MWSRMPVCELLKLHPQAPLPEILQHTLYFQNEMEPSILIEEIKLRNNSDCSDTDADTDTDTDTVGSTDSDTADDV